jgi:hypothetical protein
MEDCTHDEFQGDKESRPKSNSSPPTHADGMQPTSQATPAEAPSKANEASPCSENQILPIPQLRDDVLGSTFPSAIQLPNECSQNPVDACSEAPIAAKDVSHNAKLSLELDVGTWRETWPRDITTVINVDRSAIVRYFRGLRKLDLVRIVAKPKPDPNTPMAVYETVVRDSTWISSLPNISTLHHFEILSNETEGNVVSSTPTGQGRGGAALVNCVLCVADDLKRCIVFSLANDSFQQLNATSLPMKASHVVPFEYRGIRYFLTYFSATGDYGILPFRSVATGTPQLVAKGTFRTGWTDIVWKGTHHVRCTRQKFFCYNNVTGEAAFECVWVKSNSSTASVCSAEHTTMQVGSPKKRSCSADQRSTQLGGSTNAAFESSARSTDVDDDVHLALRRKSCIVVPMTIGGRFAAMLYSHATFNDDGVQCRSSLLNQRRQSTGRLLESGSMVNDPRQAIPLSRSLTLTNITEAASLMLRKRVFAHNEPWTHFCILSNFEQDGSISTMLCYSSISGEVWVNALYFTDTDRVAKDVTIVEASPLLVPAPPHRHPAPRSPQPAGKFGAHLEGGVGRYLSEQAERRSPFDHPIDFDHNLTGRAGAHSGVRTDSHEPRAGQARSSFSRQSTLRGGSAAPLAEGPLARRESVAGPVRPSSSSQALSLRLQLLPGATGDYRSDIARVINHISATDFPHDSPYPKLALSQVQSLPIQDARLAALLTRPTSGASPLAITSGSETPRTMSASGSSRPLSSWFKAPWKPSCPGDTYVPAPPQSPSAKFETVYGKHMQEEVPPKLDSNETVNNRLYKPGFDARALFQQHELDKIYTDLAKKQVDHGVAGPKLVSKSVEKLGVADVDQRRKREESRDKERNAREVPALHKSTNPMDAAEIQALGERLHDQVLAQRRSHLEGLKHKFAHLNPSPDHHGKLTPSTQQAMVTRLDSASVNHKAESLRRIEHEMAADTLHHVTRTSPPQRRNASPTKLTRSELEGLSARLYANEPRTSATA